MLMTLQEAKEKIVQFEALSGAYRHAMGVLSVDGATAAPKKSYIGRGRTMGELSGVIYALETAPALQEALATVRANGADCDQTLLRKCEVLQENLDDMLRIPQEEYVAYSTLLTDADAVWHEAKEKSDYAMFAPYLAKLIDFNRRFAAYKDSSKPAYDVMLNDYERGATMQTLDPFFATLREKLTPLILEIGKRPAPDTSFLHQAYPIAQQRVFSDRLMEMMGIDRDCCGIAETEHPFTDGNNKWDVRITTHYQLHDVASNMYSVIHEGGHALYELGVADELQFTCLSGGSSMGLHESQSRFYENLIGRSQPFCRAVLPVMQELFPSQMVGVTPETLYAAVNRAEPSLIRTEADELTYAMHIMIRYELEKRIIAGDVTVDELPALWNQMYKEYLGVTVPNDREGVLQDSHWSGGSFGYFPSYALGSAYGAQMLRRMEREIDLWPAVERGDLSSATDWLREHIHRFGQLKKPAELLENALGEPFDPTCFTDYLTRKFSALYGL